MAKKISYESFYKAGQQITVGVRLSATVSREINAEIVSLADDRATVELIGALPPGVVLKKGDKRCMISGWSGWGFFSCDAVLEAEPSGKELSLRLVGSVEEKQRREYFRMDVSLPIRIEVPPVQGLAAVAERFKASRAASNSAPLKMTRFGAGYRAVLPDGTEILPTEVNLSAGGLRMRMTEQVLQGNRVLIDLFLPVAPLRRIPVVAEVLRCNEVTLRLEKGSVFIAAMKFVDIDEKDREAIIAYLFAEQRNQLQAEADRSGRGR